MFAGALHRLGYRTAGLFYLSIAGAIGLWFVVGAKVIAPHVQDIELGLSAGHASQIQNRKFNDFFLNYIPELQQQLAIPRSGWIATWSGQNELGRPLYHTEGLSPAYAPTWLLTRFSDDPYVVITALVLLTAFLGGAFAFLLAREWCLHPLAALSAAMLMASTPMVAYWATFPMYFAAYCWATGLMYGFQRANKRREAGGWLTLAFSAYALLMTVYPQMTVQHAYLLAAWAGVVLWRVAREQGVRSAVAMMAYTASAIGAGALLALPAFLDLWLTASESARLTVPADFYTALFPNITSWQNAAEWFVSITAPDLFGNPSTADYPFVYNGRSAVPWVWLLAVSAIPLCLRKIWGWWLAVAICALLLLYKPLYHFGVAHFGFGFSRSNPLAVAVLPMVWIAAFALDSLLGRVTSRASADENSRRYLSLAWLVPVVACLAALVCAFSLAQATGHPIMGERLLLLGLSVLACAGLWTRYVGLAALGGVGLAAFAYGGPMVLVQDLSAIHRSSPLVEAIRARLPEGARYAWLSDQTTLPPNANATTGLPTLHTYNSLSPKSYHALIGELGGKMQVFGRHNTWIAPPDGSASLQLANIGLFLSARPLPKMSGAPLAVSGGVFIYGNHQRTGDWLAMPLGAAAVDGDGYRIAEPMHVTRLPVEQLRNTGDMLEFSLVASEPSLFVLSQKFHRQWLAEWRLGDEWRSAPTVRVNGFFQGVVIPRGAQAVRLSFQPWVRYAWYAHLFFAVTGLFVMLRFAWTSRGSLTRHI